jgi:hypothetical protein
LIHDTKPTNEKTEKEEEQWITTQKYRSILDKMKKVLTASDIFDMSKDEFYDKKGKFNK